MRGVKENLEEKMVARIPRGGVESTDKAREYKSPFLLVCHARRKRKPLEKNGPWRNLLVVMLDGLSIRGTTSSLILTKNPS